MDQIATDPKAGMEEKKNMMEMLRRFEEAQVEGDDRFAELEGGDEEEDEENELRAKLEGIDIGWCTMLRSTHLAVDAGGKADS